MQTDDALEFALRGDDAQAGAVQPDPVAEAVLHPVLDGESVLARGGGVGAELIGRSERVFGVDELLPGFVGVGQLGIDVAEEFFPRRRVVSGVGLEIEVEDGEPLVGCEQADALLERGRGGGRRRGCGGGRGGGRRRGCERGEVRVERPGEFLEFQADLDRGAFARERLEGERAAARGTGEDLPLRFEELGIVGDDFELEQADERLANEFVVSGLPESAGGGVGGQNDALLVEKKDRQGLSRRRGRGRGGRGCLCGSLHA